VRALTYSVRPLTILKYFGQLCVILALLTLVPLVVSIALGEYHSTLRYAIVAAGVFVIWLCLRRLPSPKNIQTNEAMVIAALAFIFAPLLAAWPLMFPGVTFGDALFEAISGITTTGLSVTASLADKPAIFLFSRSWLQWTGGWASLSFFWQL
jgi:trk system potassium uptake protein TrkH